MDTDKAQDIIKHLKQHTLEQPGLFPSAQNTLHLIDNIQKLIFADYYQADALQILHDVQPLLQEQIARSLACGNINRPALDYSWKLLEQLPQIRSVLNTDIQATFDGDPACETLHLPVLCYPGILSLTYHRVAHELYKHQIPILPRIINELAHSKTGIDIHPGATIGKSCFIDHGTGVVIGETTIIGDNVKIYHGVTLGAKKITKQNIKRHPNIGNNVTIYSNAVILGNINIGDNSVIGGNVWITQSVPANSSIYLSKPKIEIVTAE